MDRQREGDELEVLLIEAGKKLEQEIQRRQRRHHQRQAARGFQGAPALADGPGQHHGEREHEQVEEEKVFVLVGGPMGAQQRKPGDEEAGNAGEQRPQSAEQKKEGTSQVTLTA